MNLHVHTDKLYNLIDQTLSTGNLAETLSYATLQDFVLAVGYLETTGLNQRHLQLVIDRPFSQFHDRDFMNAMALAISVKLGTIKKYHWQEALREKVSRKTFLKLDPWFETETLPDMSQIDRELGFRDAPRHVSLAASGQAVCLAARSES